MESAQHFLTDKAQQSTVTADLTNIRLQDNPTHTHRLLHQELPIYRKDGNDRCTLNKISDTSFLIQLNMQGAKTPWKLRGWKEAKLR